MSGRVTVLQGDAAHLPLPDASVDLLMCSPPYFGLRSYTDGGEVYDGQIGSEATPREFIDALLTCTREWVRVLKPSGSIFVNLGDKYSTYTGANYGNGRSLDGNRGQAKVPNSGPVNAPEVYGIPYKSLMGLPWRYALGCIDDLSLILRAEIIWSKPSPMPESAKDRVRRSHEQVFHFTKAGRYFSAVDEIREPTPNVGRKSKAVKAGPLTGSHGSAGHDGNGMRMAEEYNNPLGKPPVSVWEIAAAPLVVPAHLHLDHFAAYPPELCRRIIQGWSPPGICTSCGEGRRPVAPPVTREPNDRLAISTRARTSTARGTHVGSTLGYPAASADRQIIGYACACTPYTDHPERRGKDFHAKTDRATQGMNDRNGAERARRYAEETANPRGPVREYHFEDWTPPPTRRALVVDPFGGTGTTALVASVLSRDAATVDLSADYCRLATWRTQDPAERARALGVPKPPPVADGQESLFDLDGAA